LATITKSQRIIQAALAPLEPSSQDRGVAAQASVMMFKARQEMAREAYGEANNNTPESPSKVSIQS
jgi:hypothetical protein